MPRKRRTLVLPEIEPKKKPTDTNTIETDQPTMKGLFNFLRVLAIGRQQDETDPT